MSDPVELLLDEEVADQYHHQQSTRGATGKRKKGSNDDADPESGQPLDGSDDELPDDDDDDIAAPDRQTLHRDMDHVTLTNLDKYADRSIIERLLSPSPPDLVPVDRPLTEKECLFIYGGAVLNTRPSHNKTVAADFFADFTIPETLKNVQLEPYRLTHIRPASNAELSELITRRSMVESLSVRVARACSRANELARGAIAERQAGRARPLISTFNALNRGLTLDQKRDWPEFVHNTVKDNKAMRAKGLIETTHRFYCVLGFENGTHARPVRRHCQFVNETGTRGSPSQDLPPVNPSFAIDPMIPDPNEPVLYTPLEAFLSQQKYAGEIMVDITKTLRVQPPGGQSPISIRLDELTERFVSISLHEVTVFSSRCNLSQPDYPYNPRSKRTLVSLGIDTTDIGGYVIPFGTKTVIVSQESKAFAHTHRRIGVDGFPFVSFWGRNITMGEVGTYDSITIRLDLSESTPRGTRRRGYSRIAGFRKKVRLGTSSVTAAAASALTGPGPDQDVVDDKKTHSKKFVTMSDGSSFRDQAHRNSAPGTGAECAVCLQDMGTPQASTKKHLDKLYDELLNGANSVFTKHPTLKVNLYIASRINLPWIVPLLALGVDRADILSHVSLDDEPSVVNLYREIVELSVRANEQIETSEDALAILGALWVGEDRDDAYVLRELEQEELAGVPDEQTYERLLRKALISQGRYYIHNRFLFNVGNSDAAVVVDTKIAVYCELTNQLLLMYVGQLPETVPTSFVNRTLITQDALLKQNFMSKLSEYLRLIMKSIKDYSGDIIAGRLLVRSFFESCDVLTEGMRHATSRRDNVRHAVEETNVRQTLQTRCRINITSHVKKIVDRRSLYSDAGNRLFDITAMSFLSVETPNGKHSGYIKTLTSTTHVTMELSSREWISMADFVSRFTGCCPPSTSVTRTDPNRRSVRVFMDSWWIGTFDDNQHALELEHVLRGIKRNPIASRQMREISITRITPNRLWIRTTSGRMVRPIWRLFHDPSRPLRIPQRVWIRMQRRHNDETTDWTGLLTSTDGMREAVRDFRECVATGAIEYIDVTTFVHSHVATHPAEAMNHYAKTVSLNSASSAVTGCELYLNPFKDYLELHQMAVKGDTESHIRRGEHDYSLRSQTQMHTIKQATCTQYTYNYNRKSEVAIGPQTPVCQSLSNIWSGDACVPYGYNQVAMMICTNGCNQEDGSTFSQLSNDYNSAACVRVRQHSKTVCMTRADVIQRIMRSVYTNGIGLSPSQVVVDPKTGTISICDEKGKITSSFMKSIDNISRHEGDTTTYTEYSVLPCDDASTSSTDIRPVSYEQFQSLSPLAQSLVRRDQCIDPTDNIVRSGAIIQPDQTWIRMQHVPTELIQSRLRSWVKQSLPYMINMYEGFGAVRSESNQIQQADAPFRLSSRPRTRAVALEKTRTLAQVTNVTLARKDANCVQASINTSEMIYNDESSKFMHDGGQKLTNTKTVPVSLGAATQDGVFIQAQFNVHSQSRKTCSRILNGTEGWAAAKYPDYVVPSTGLRVGLGESFAHDYHQHHTDRDLSNGLIDVLAMMNSPFAEWTYRAHATMDARWTIDMLLREEQKRGDNGYVATFSGEIRRLLELVLHHEAVEWMVEDVNKRRRVAVLIEDLCLPIVEGGDDPSIVEKAGTMLHGIAGEWSASVASDLESDFDIPSWIGDTVRTHLPLRIRNRLCDSIYKLRTANDRPVPACSTGDLSVRHDETLVYLNVDTVGLNRREWDRRKELFVWTPRQVLDETLRQIVTD